MAETGHAKNVENWQKMIAACTGFGGDYKPSNANLTVASMTTLLTDVETEMDGVQTSIVPWKNKVADREAESGHFKQKLFYFLKFKSFNLCVLRRTCTVE